MGFVIYMMLRVNIWINALYNVYSCTQKRQCKRQTGVMMENACLNKSHLTGMDVLAAVRVCGTRSKLKQSVGWRYTRS